MNFVELKVYVGTNFSGLDHKDEKVRSKEEISIKTKLINLDQVEEVGRYRSSSDVKMILRMTSGSQHITRDSFAKARETLGI